MLWIGSKIDFKQIKQITDGLEAPFVLVVAQGSDQVAVSVSFAQPRSNILRAHSLDNDGSLNQEADAEHEATGAAQRGPDRINRP